MSDNEFHAEVKNETCASDHPNIYDEPKKPMDFNTELNTSGDTVIKQKYTTELYDKKKDEVKFPGTNVSLILIIMILFAILFLSLSIVLLVNNKYNIDYNVTLSFLIFLLLLIFAFAYYISPAQEIAVKLPCEGDIFDPSDIKKGKEVYNIGNNLLTYHEAEQVCKAFDGELASLNQMLDAHNKGADWCHYGWIKDRMGVFPTQSETVDDLRDKENYLDCGITGVNGQEFEKLNYPKLQGLDNPPRSYVLLGANCYGVKPT